MTHEITLRGKRIGSDENGYLCLTDMWKIAGEPGQKKPFDFCRLPTTRELTIGRHY